MAIPTICARDLSQALAGDQFDLLYQPVIDLSTRRVTKAEALIRWRHPQHGYLTPDAFIAQAESLGLIDALGGWVLRRTLRDLGRLQAHHPDVELSINVSPLQIESGSFSEAALRQGFEAHGVNPARLIVEITEGVALKSGASNRERVARIRAAGVKLAIDDFGMGHSALTSLIHFPCDFIKLDRMFVRASPEDRALRAIARLIVAMAHELGLQVIAEGVETESDVAHVLALGCDHAQGYYWSEPYAFETLRAALGPGDRA